ncbi:MAG: hypothetical protein ABJF50_10590 [Paracoccaceae bacterium]
MTRWIALIAMAFANSAHADADQILDAIRKEVNELAMEVANEDVPDLLVQAIDASTSLAHSSLRRIILRDAGIKPVLGMKGIADNIAAHVLINEVMTPHEITTGFALRAYFGRDCYGWRAASAGLLSVQADQEDDISLVTLAALTIAPSRYIRDERHRTERVARILENLTKAQTIAPERLDSLRNSAIPDPNVGPGC